MRLTNRCLHTFVNELVHIILIRNNDDNNTLEATGIITEVFTNKDTNMTFVVVQTHSDKVTRIKLGPTNNLAMKMITIKSDNAKMLFKIEHDIA